MKLNFIKYHIFPILLSLLILYVFSFFLTNSNHVQIKKIEGLQTNKTRIQENYINGILSEINFVSSLKNKNNIVLLGSSEFGNSALNYYPYKFLKQHLWKRYSYHYYL